VVGAILIAGLLGFLVESQGVQFLDAGSAILVTLDGFAAQIREQGVITEFLSDEYAAPVLALTQPGAESDRDGIHSWRFTPGTAHQTRSEANESWTGYIAAFSHIEEVSFDIHHLDEWSGERSSAVARFELLGTLEDGRPAVDRFLFRIGADSADPPLITSIELLEGTRTAGDRPHFTEVGEQAGIAFEAYQYPGFAEADLKFSVYAYAPAGIAATDLNDDGFADLFIPDGIESKLFRNRQDGTFEDITDVSGLGGLSGVQVAIAADYDNDGDRDFFIARSFQPDQLFRNDGGGFVDVTATAGFDSDCCTTVAAWADYDLDGDLDLYLGRYLDPREDFPESFYAANGKPNQLYRNDGPGRGFTNVTEEAGVGHGRLCLGVAFGDYDGDGDPDIYVANDYGRNALFQNRGDGTFEDVGVAAGTLAYGAGMNATFGDYDNDGLLDIYVTNIRSKYTWFADAPMVRRYLLHALLDGTWMSEYPRYFEILREWDGTFVEAFEQMASGNNLLRNRGDGTFEDRTWQSSVNPPGWYWGAVMADFDNDGWKDIYAANGWIYEALGTELEMDFLTSVVSEQDLFAQGALFDMETFGDRSWHGYERNRHLRNCADGTFEEIGWASGSDLIRNSRGVAVADFWNRGVLDVAVAAHEDHHALLRNEVGQTRNWIAVELRGVASNRDAVGARVTIEANGRRQMREVSLGDGYASQSTLRQHFGLDADTHVETLSIFWPKTGLTDTFTNVAANQIVQMIEGESEWTTRPIGASTPPE